MQTVICTRYGLPDVLQLQDVAEPAPQEDEVLIRVRASPVNARDWLREGWDFRPFRFARA